MLEFCYHILEYHPRSSRGLWVISMFSRLCSKLSSLYSRILIYRVIVNEWYKIKQGTRRRIRFFQVSTCIPRKWVLEHLISMQYFATQSNYLLIMNDLPNGPIRCFRSTGHFRRMRQYGLFWSMRMLNQSSVRVWASENSLLFSPKKYSCTAVF